MVDVCCCYDVTRRVWCGQFGGPYGRIGGKVGGSHRGRANKL